MRLERVVQYHIPGPCKMTARIACFLVVTGEDERCIRMFMNMAVQGSDTDRLRHTHR